MSELPTSCPRRGFLKRAAGLGAAMSLPVELGGCGEPSSAAPRWGGEVLLSAQGDLPSTHGLVISSLQGSTTLVDSGFRGHDVARNLARPREVLMFGRRPGFETIVVDLDEARVVRRLVLDTGTAFQGHGCFTPDGAYLFTSEATVDDARGRIGVWDARTYQRLDAMDSGGVGPHEIALRPDSNLLVVANGGLLTRPETGRAVLNLDTMTSSLTYLDPWAARVVDAVGVDEPKSSIRHFDVLADGTVVFGVQVQRAAAGHERVVPLGFVHRLGDPVQALEEPSGIVAALQDYVGSVAIAPGSRVVGLTSPRGDVAAFWDVDHGLFVGHHRLADVCGIAASSDGDRFILTSSTGEVRTLNAADLFEERALRRHLDQVVWDNHVLAVSI